MVRLSVLAMLAAVMHLAGVSSAAPLPVATAIADVAVIGLAIPADAANKPTAVVVAGTGFTVVVTFAGGLPLSYTRDSVVSLTVEDTSATGSRSTPPAFVGGSTITVPAGQTSATSTALILDAADNRISLKATVTGGSKDARAAAPKWSPSFDVARQGVAYAATQKVLSTMAGGCTPTPAIPHCADLYVPNVTANGTVVTVGPCDAEAGCASSNEVVQFLAGLGPYVPGQPAPATVILKCDKSACKGGGVSSYQPGITLSAAGALDLDPPSCGAKGVPDGPNGYCVDYVQSKRDGAGDLHIYVLFARDARSMCC